MPANGKDVDKRPIWSGFSPRGMALAKDQAAKVMFGVEQVLKVDEYPEIVVTHCLQTTGRLCIQVCGVKIANKKNISSAVYVTDGVAILPGGRHLRGCRPLWTSVRWHYHLSQDEILNAIIERARDRTRVRESEPVSNGLPRSHRLPKPEAPCKTIKVVTRQNRMDPTKPLATYARELSKAYYELHAMQQ